MRAIGVRIRSRNVRPDEIGPNRGKWLVAWLLVTTWAATCPTGLEAATPQAADHNGFHVERGGQQVAVTYRGKPLAIYVFEDPDVKRPYWKQLHGPAGQLLSRAYPPTNADDRDHAHMHPGLWLAFGNLNGHDFWRNRARVRQRRFLHEPSVEVAAESDREIVRFSVENQYLADDQEVAREQVEFAWSPDPLGLVLHWRSTLRGSTSPLVLGAQEELGLGIRVASDLRVKQSSGTIRNSRGGVNEAGTWGQEATWWSYARESSDRVTGWLICAMPTTTTPLWGHTRDYGLLVVNPGPMPDASHERLVVPESEALHLEFAILLFDQPSSQTPDYDEWARQVILRLPASPSTHEKPVGK